MKMSFKLALLCLGLSLTYANAQVGMPTNNPNKDAVLDLNRTDGTSAKGLLLPKVALTGTNDAEPMSTHVEGMHIWNTATVTGANAVIPGEYYNDGTKWVRVASADDFVSANNAWLLDGNNNGTVKAIGTNDKLDLPIETNGIEKMRVTSEGQILVNTATPLAGGTTAKLQINNGTTAGALQLVDGTQATNRILTSDANGIATWQTNSPKVYNGTLYPTNVSLSPPNSFKYTGYFIDVPPGRSQVTAGYLIIQAGGSAGYVTAQLSTSWTSLSQSSFSCSPNLAGFSCAPGSSVGQTTWYVTNPSSGNLRLYIMMIGGGGAASASSITVAGSTTAGEPFLIVAY